jgi:hypothetical protein
LKLCANELEPSDLIGFRALLTIFRVTCMVFEKHPDIPGFLGIRPTYILWVEYPPGEPLGSTRASGSQV